LELYPKGSLVGWKVGATNQKALTTLGLSEPLRGPLLSEYVHKNEADIPVLQWSEMGVSLLAAEVQFSSTNYCIMVASHRSYLMCGCACRRALSQFRTYRSGRVRLSDRNVAA
jgi:hypothetical protein